MLVRLLEEGSSIILRSSNGNSNSNWCNFSCSARFTHSQISRSDLCKKIVQLISTASHNKRQRPVNKTCPITTLGVVSITWCDRLPCQAVNIMNGNIY